MALNKLREGPKAILRAHPELQEARKAALRTLNKLQEAPKAALRAINEFREDPKAVLRTVPSRLKRGAEASARFLKTSYVDGSRALLAGHYTRRQAMIIIAGTLPTILGALLITFPGVLFPSPGHNEFYYFANMLGDDSTSLIPMGLGAVTSTLGLRIPLG